MAERKELAQTLWNKCSPHIRGSFFGRTRRAADLPKICPSSTNINHKLAQIGKERQIWANVSPIPTEIDQLWQNVGKFGRVPSKLANVGRCLVSFGRSWPKLVRHNSSSFSHIRPCFVEIGPTLRSSPGSHGEACQDVWRESVPQQLDRTHLCHNGPEGRRHRIEPRSNLPILAAPGPKYGEFCQHGPRFDTEVFALVETSRIHSGGLSQRIHRALPNASVRFMQNALGHGQRGAHCAWAHNSRRGQHAIVTTRA